MDELFNQVLAWIGYADAEGSWPVKVFLIIFVSLTVNYLARKFYDRLEKRFEKSRTLLDDSFLAAIRGPSSFFVLLVGGRFAMEVMEPHLDSAANELVSPVFLVLVIVTIIWLAIKTISEGEKLLNTPGYTERPLDTTTVSAVAKLLRLSVVITGALVVAQTMGVSVSGVLAFGGIGGIAVGFAAKDLLANFFGGLMVYLDRPFSVGDWVRSPDRSIEGTVEHIGWRLTVIRTFDKRPLYVPNATFTSIALENPSRMSHRRIYETMGIRYQDLTVLPLIIEDIKRMLISHDEIDTSQTMIVNFDRYGASSLDFFVYTFTVTTNWIRYHEVKQDVLFLISEIVEKHGAEFAYPTQTLHLLNEEPQLTHNMTQQPANHA